MISSFFPKTIIFSTKSDSLHALFLLLQALKKTFDTLTKFKQRLYNNSGLFNVNIHSDNYSL
ncbi:MAG: hypothetical protein CFE25_09100 [Chitinophagaceae bacterium BSSC1]|nr:MAG: hypothetical protein CFE25_09100 [Chitinophagaceae bacterium BSSC1]